MDELAPGMKDVDGEQQLQQQSASSPGVPLRPQANAKADSYTAFFGKHRMAAAISNLHNQINMIQVVMQEELEQLETLGNSSIVCKELISSLDSVRDPLLPSTVGPADVSWDRWFRGAHNSRNHKRWI